MSALPLVLRSSCPTLQASRPAASAAQCQAQIAQLFVQALPNNIPNPRQPEIRAVCKEPLDSKTTETTPRRKLCSLEAILRCLGQATGARLTCQKDSTPVSARHLLCEVAAM
eukprot:s2555_g9.t1